MSLRLLLDECLGGAFATRLEEAGYDIVRIESIAPSSEDGEVFEIAIRERRILVTADRDFGRRAVVEQRRVPGVCIVRGEAGAADADRLMALSAELAGSLVLLTRTVVRIRAVGFFRTEEGWL